MGNYGFNQKGKQYGVPGLLTLIEAILKKKLTLLPSQKNLTKQKQRKQTNKQKTKQNEP